MCEEDNFGGVAVESDVNDARSIRTVVPRELERVDEDDENQMVRQEEQQQHHVQRHEEGEEERRRRVEIVRPWTPQPMTLGMSHLGERATIRPS
ncbi:hypothetical protein PILCRDRAFT_812506 [Piloderma croceum F 1598]|uniref:Uncharacterized protein n=1 Tax=Piloderma croceum (strain F 1598) TaxID=765440 RepID=A0A0C3G0I1_PILCF|nr:hypothetical protein PILCRDRAFT_812506 [Piloderma croceum F 1598]